MQSLNKHIHTYTHIKRIFYHLKSTKGRVALKSHTYVWCCVRWQTVCVCVIIINIIIQIWSAFWEFRLWYMRCGCVCMSFASGDDAQQHDGGGVGMVLLVITVTATILWVEYSNNFVIINGPTMWRWRSGSGDSTHFIVHRLMYLLYAEREH